MTRSYCTRGNKETTAEHDRLGNQTRVMILWFDIYCCHMLCIL